MHFGRDVLSAPDVDLEDLLSALAPSEITQLVDEMAADPDDKHLPASVRTAYRCSKPPTGELNRDSLINHINQEGINAPSKEEAVPFEAGKKRGKVFVPKYNEAELAAIARKNEIAEAVRLDDDEEAALGGATVDDLMSLAEILDSNPQEFIMEAYADPLKFYPPDPANATDVSETVKLMLSNNKDTKDVNLNNIGGIDEKVFCEMFDGFRTNDTVVRFSAVNCEVNDFAASTLNLALENNQALKSLNLESNRISPDTLAALFESIESTNNGIVEIQLSNQAQANMGYRVESRIADAICKNTTLLKVGLKFQFTEVMDRVQTHLMANSDRARKERLKSGNVSNVKWRPAKTIDQ